MNKQYKSCECASLWFFCWFMFSRKLNVSCCCAMGRTEQHMVNVFSRAYSLDRLKISERERDTKKKKQQKFDKTIFRQYNINYSLYFFGVARTRWVYTHLTRYVSECIANGIRDRNFVGGKKSIIELLVYTRHLFVPIESIVFHRNIVESRSQIVNNGTVGFM